MGSDTDLDPELRRIQELLDRVSTGSIDAAEREELALHAERRPELLHTLAGRQAEGELGAGWLARLEQDRKVQAVANTRGTTVVRAVAVGAILCGLVLGPLVGFAGSLVSLAGAAVLLGSFVRARLREHALDPYKGIRR